MFTSSRVSKFVGVLGIVGMFGFAGAASAAVSGTAHDLRTDKTGAGAEEICVFCHTPHGGAADAPLWNRTMSSASYTLYDSASFIGTNQSDPAGVSKACLSCHDGTVAFNAVTNDGTNGTPTPLLVDMTAAPGGGLIGTNLTNQHPISVDYPASGAGFVALASVQGSSDVQLYSNGTIDNRVECGSCHNPHDTTVDKFLRSSNADSALCLSCHVK